MSITRRSAVVGAVAAGTLLAAPAVAGAFQEGSLPQVTSGPAVIMVDFTTPGGTGFNKNCTVTVTGQDTIVPVVIPMMGSAPGGEPQSFTFAPLPPGHYTVDVNCVNTNPDFPNQWTFTESDVLVTFPDDPLVLLDLLVEWLS